MRVQAGNILNLATAGWAAMLDWPGWRPPAGSGRPFWFCCLPTAITGGGETNKTGHTAADAVGVGLWSRQCPDLTPTLWVALHRVAAPAPCFASRLWTFWTWHWSEAEADVPLLQYTHKQTHAGPLVATHDVMQKQTAQTRGWK